MDIKKSLKQGFALLATALTLGTGAALGEKNTIKIIPANNDNLSAVKNTYGAAGTFINENSSIVTTGGFSDIKNNIITGTNDSFKGNLSIGYANVFDKDLNFPNGLDIGDSNVIVKASHLDRAVRAVPVGTGQGVSNSVLVADDDGSLRKIVRFRDKVEAVEIVVKNLRTVADNNAKPVDGGENRIYGNTTLTQESQLFGNNFLDDVYASGTTMADSIATPGAVLLNSYLQNSDAGDTSKLLEVVLVDSNVGVGTLIVPNFATKGETRPGHTYEQNIVCMAPENSWGDGGIVRNNEVIVLTGEDAARAKQMFKEAYVAQLPQSERPTPKAVAGYIASNLKNGPLRN